MEQPGKALTTLIRSSRCIPEARVFKKTAAGWEVKQVAEHLGVAQSTIQTHIRRLFLKTGVRRQIDLVRIATSLATPI